MTVAKYIVEQECSAVLMCVVEARWRGDTLTLRTICKQTGFYISKVCLRVGKLIDDGVVVRETRKDRTIRLADNVHVDKKGGVWKFSKCINTDDPDGWKVEW